MSSRTSKSSSATTLNSQVMDALNTSGTLNHISAEFFSRVAEFANEDKKKSISSHATAPETVAERLAARLVYEYLKNRSMLLTTAAFKAECPTQIIEKSSPTLFKQLNFRKSSHLLRQIVEDRLKKKDGDESKSLHDNSSKLTSRSSKSHNTQTPPSSPAERKRKSNPSSPSHSSRSGATSPKSPGRRSPKKGKASSPRKQTKEPAD